MERLHTLAQKNIVNIDDGVCIGKIADVELDRSTGRITAIVIAGKMRAFGLLGRRAEVVIPWEMITKIGNDVILVRLGTAYTKKAAL